MKHHESHWQQFAKSGDPMIYLAYKQNRHEDNKDIKKRHEKH